MRANNLYCLLIEIGPRRKVVIRRSAKSLCASSILAVASINLKFQILNLKFFI